MASINNIDIEAGSSQDVIEEAINRRVCHIPSEADAKLNSAIPTHGTSDLSNRETSVKLGPALKARKPNPVPVHSRPRVKKRKAIVPSEELDASKLSKPNPVPVHSRPRVKKRVDAASVGANEVTEMDGSNSGEVRRNRNINSDRSASDIVGEMTMEEKRDRRRRERTQPRRTPTAVVRGQKNFFQKILDLTHKVVKPSDWSQILVINLATLTALTGSVLFSARPPDTSTTPTPSTNSIRTEDPFPYLHLLPTNQRTLTNQVSNVTIEIIDPNYGSIVPIALAVLTSPWTYNLLNTFGRKKTLMLAALPQILAGMLVRVDDIYVFYFTRFLSGLSDSISYVALPTYIGEVATPHVRGTWGNSMAVNTYLGNSLLNGIESFFQVSITSYVLVFLPILVLFIFSCVPEPPHYHLLKGKINSAWKSLKYLRRTDDINTEFQSIKEDVDQQKDENIGFSKLFHNIRHRKSLLMAIMVRCCEQFCGIGALRLYTQQMFRETIEDISFNDATLIYSVIMTVATTVSATFVSKIGRRRAMCVSSYGCAVFLLLIALYYHLLYETSEDVSSFDWVPMFGLIGFIPMYALGLGIVPTLILGEIFAMGIKAKALCVMYIVLTFLIAAMDIMFYYLFTNFGMSTPFFFYSSSCLVSLILNYFFLPDMDDLTLPEIQETMNVSVKESTFERLKTAVRVGREK